MQNKISSESQLLGEIRKLQEELEQLRSITPGANETPDLRLRIIHEIEHSILSLQNEKKTAQIALEHVMDIVPDYHSSSVILIDKITQSPLILAIDHGEFGAFPSVDNLESDLVLQLESQLIDHEILQKGRSFQLEDLYAIPQPTDFQSRMKQAGIRSYLAVPLIASGELVGILNLASSSPGVFREEQNQIAQEIADTLAIAIQQANLRSVEQQVLQEAEVMRDIMAALASAGTLNQTLEIILVNLHNVIAYDRAALYLLDDQRRYVPAENAGLNLENQFRSHFDDDPIITEMRASRCAISIADIQGDSRFSTWPDMEAIRGWLGAPLMVGQEMIGFISLGSLEADAYDESDIALVQGFTGQVSQVLEKVWLQEQSHRRTEELEVLSSLSFALGLEDSQEGTLSAIIEQITKIFNARCGTFIIPQNQDTQLRVLFSQDENLIGISHRSADDPIWQVFLNGEILVISDAFRLLEENRSTLFQSMFKGMNTAALLPIQTGDKNFGVLCLSFEEERRVTSEEINLLSTISEIAGTSLKRAVELEALERQVNKRNQRLSTLYTINAVANEALDLETSLNQLLKIAVEIKPHSVGAIHLIDLDANKLKMASYLGFPEEEITHLNQFELDEETWTPLLFSPQPLVMADISKDNRVPLPWRQAGIGKRRSFIGAPIRAKGIPLGLLSLFSESIQDFSIEDITLLMTIASQIGAIIERNRLIGQAEQAAVLEERQRLARELHDSVTQLLYSQVLFASAGEKSLLHGKVEPAQQYLTRIDQAALQALKEMRILVYELNPQQSLSEGLVKALEQRLDAVERRAGIEAGIEVSGNIDLDEKNQLNLYRLIQEALNNALKHSSASSVRINLRQELESLRVEIEDNGSGFKLQEQALSGGMGLTNMQDRAADLGADLLINSEPGQGTRITLMMKDSP